MVANAGAQILPQWNLRPRWDKCSNITGDCVENSRILWNPKVYYRVLESSSLVPVVSRINPVNALILFFEDQF
jgi:hypothetical protein